MSSYIAFDAFCIIIFLVIRAEELRYNMFSTSRRAFCRFVDVSILIILSDLGWAVVSSMGLGATFLGPLVNLLYFCISGFVGYTAVVWLEHERREAKVPRVILVMMLVPTAVTIILSVASLWTGWIFYIDELGNYHRGPLIFVQRICVYGPTLVYSVGLFARVLRDPPGPKRRQGMILSFFPVPIFAAQLLDGFAPGLSLMNGGLAISCLWVYSILQNRMISRDSLTGLNNRYQLDNFLYNNITVGSGRKTYYACMLDIDYFKSINDKYGHLEGDRTLKAVADILRRNAGELRCSIYRYGGDEFIIIIDTEDEQLVNSLCDKLRLACIDKSKELGRSFSLSIGVAKYVPGQSAYDFIAAADRELYSSKKKR